MANKKQDNSDNNNLESLLQGVIKTLQNIDDASSPALNALLKEQVKIAKRLEKLNPPKSETKIDKLEKRLSELSNEIKKEKSNIKQEFIQKKSDIQDRIKQNKREDADKAKNLLLQKQFYENVDRAKEKQLHDEFNSWQKNRTIEKQFYNSIDKDKEKQLHDEFNSWQKNRTIEKLFYAEIDRSHEKKLHNEILEWEKSKEKQRKEDEKNLKKDIEEHEKLAGNIFRGFAQIATPIISDILMVNMAKGAAKLNKLTGNMPWIHDFLTSMLLFAPIFAQGIMFELSRGFVKLGGKLGLGIASKIKGILPNILEATKEGTPKALKFAENLITKVPQNSGMTGKASKFLEETAAKSGKLAPLLGGASKFAKFIPFIGAAVNAVGAYKDFKKGDIAGGVLNTAAGITSLIPFLEPLSWILDAIILIKDNFGWFSKQFVKLGNWTKGIFSNIFNWFKKTILNPETLMKTLSTMLDTLLMSNPLFASIKIVMDLLKKVLPSGKQVVQAVNNIVHTTKQVVGSTIKSAERLGTQIIKGTYSLGSYKKGEGQWSTKRGQAKSGQMESFASAGLIYDQGAFAKSKKGKYLTDAPEARKDFTESLKGARQALKKLYGSSADFILTGGHAVAKGAHAADSRHNYGTAVDIGRAKGVSPSQLTKVLAQYGITRPNATGDPLHFEYTGTTNKNLNTTRTVNKKDEKSINKTTEEVTRKSPTSSGTPSNIVHHDSTPIASLPQSSTDPTGYGALLHSLNNGTSVFS